MKKSFLITIFFIISSLFADQEYIRLKAGVHFDSQVSGGKYSLEELAQIIDASDLDVAIITDHDNMDVRLGSNFFRRAFSFSVKRNSIVTFGFENYFNKIDQLNQMFPQVEIIPGTEAVPYYNWQGRVLDQNLVLKNWHRHLLIFGMPNPNDYKNLPSIKNGFPAILKNENKINFIKNHFYYYVLLLITFLLFFLTLFSLFRKRRRKRRRPKYGKLIFLLLLAIFLALEFPYLRSDVSQYDRKSNKRAFHHLIDYVNDRNGVIFWAHPEAEYSEEIPLNIPFFQNSIKIETEKYSKLVYETQNHTGFAGFWEGMNVLGKPGGLWDIALQEYCTDARDNPMFIMGELDFEETNNLQNITETNTFIFVKNRTQEEIIDAFRKGRMYATRGFLGDKIVIDEFRAFNPQTEHSAFMGETLDIDNTPVAIHLKIHALKAIKPVTFTLYRNDIPIKNFVVNGSLDEWYIDQYIPTEEKFYYKIYVGKNWQNLVTNPIFINNK